MYFKHKLSHGNIHSVKISRVTRSPEWIAFTKTSIRSILNIKRFTFFIRTSFIRTSSRLRFDRNFRLSITLYNAVTFLLRKPSSCKAFLRCLWGFKGSQLFYFTQPQLWSLFCCMGQCFFLKTRTENLVPSSLDKPTCSHFIDLFQHKTIF